MADLLARMPAAVRGAAVGVADHEQVMTIATFTVDLAAKKVVRDNAEVRPA
jgi:two-component system KDP operon response regulator KdpE